LDVKRLPQALGAVVSGLDLSHGMRADVGDALRSAWREHLVLFFPDLRLDDDQHIALGSLFGHLAATATDKKEDRRGHETQGPNGEVLVLDGSRREDRADTWHTDVTFTAKPPIGSLLAMKVCPPRGGDTMWSNQYAAYEGLAEPVRRFVDGLEAVHGSVQTGSTTHPLVTTHPETGRRALFVNRGWTRQVVGLSKIESDGVLNMLFAHAERSEFVVRWTWSAGDAALWDNRCTMHYAVNDYGEAPRRLHRVTIYDR
jgi:taurine dioxygenase